MLLERGMRGETSPPIAPAGILRHTDGGWWIFARFDAVLSTSSLAEVLPLLAEVDSAWRAGWHAMGFLAYEAAPACDAALAAHPPISLPLAWFGLCRCPEIADTLPVAPAPPNLSWSPSISAEDYFATANRIREYIAQGDTYQVNFTFRLRASCAYDPWPFFLHLCRNQPTDFNAYLDLGEHVICSASPELFFRLDGSSIECRPMKGTARRGRWSEEDEEMARWLQNSSKDQAENAMIVDMVRNDLGRIAAIGSVEVRDLFAVERLPTVWQMTSAVHAKTAAALPEIMKALFPCASVTGAPKVRTMQIIRELETAPRGIYCGCIGSLHPGRRASFAVAIRTAHFDRHRCAAEYGVGSGIVWDSTVEREYRECLDKALALTATQPAFCLLETILWKPGGGYFLLAMHMRRLLASAAYFGFAADEAAIRKSLAERAALFSPQRQRVRLLLAKDGAIAIESAPLPCERPRRPWRLAMAAEPVDADNRFLYHKTTWRAMYEQARANRPESDDVILWNRKGEITETTIANVVVRFGDRLFTPAIACGLLPGVFRQRLLQSGRVQEAVIGKEDLHQADALWLVNSVRGWMPAMMIKTVT